MARIGAGAVGIFDPVLRWLRKDTSGAAGTGLGRAAAGEGRRSLRGRPANPRQRARPFASRSTTRDPIDVVSGEVLLRQVDVRLAGALPLLLERTHVSSWSEGRLFGRSWASTLDQRLEIDRAGACFASSDGMILAYPPAAPGVAVLPLEGPRLPLTLGEDGVHTIGDRRSGRTLHFAASGAGVLPLTAITDRNGHRIDLDRDEDGTLTEVRDSAGRRLAVDTEGGRIVALRLVAAVENGTAGDHPLTRYAYDDAGDLREVIDSSGRPQRFDYDGEGRLVRWTDRNGSWYAYDYDERGRAVRGTGSGGFLNARLAYGRQATTVTDSLGHETVHHFNELGQVIAEVGPLGGTTRSAWDRRDRLLARTDPLGHVTRYTYDADGELTVITRPDGGRITAEYDAGGHPTRITDADGATWRNTYDPRGNLVRAVDPTGAARTYDYDGRGHLTAVSDAAGTVRVESDPAGLTVAIADPTGRSTRYVRDVFGRVTEIVDPAGGSFRLGWTPEGRPASCARPGGATEHWRYDAEGNLVEHVDALGQATRYEITHFDRCSARTGPDGARFTFSYDTELRLTSVTGPSGLTWRYTYDAAGRPIRETDFNGRGLGYAFDAAGRLTERTNGMGQVTTYARDVLGNIVEERSGDSVATFGHDPAGRLVHAVNADADLRFRRDALGRITAEICNGRVLEVEYDSAGRRARRRTPSGAVSTWEYDAAGRPVALRAGGGTIRFGHDEAGREIRRRLGESAVLGQDWDAGNRLGAQTIWGSAAEADRGLRPLENRTYTYRADGHVDAVGETAGVRRFDLDPSGRVTAVHAWGWTERYVYGTGGDLTHAERPGDDTAGTDGDREYTGTLLRRAGETHYEHDAQGRVVLRRRGSPSTAFTWDADDRLVAVVTPGGERWRYRYDPLGRRVAKQRLGEDGRTVVEQTDFVWDGLVLAEEVHGVRPPGREDGAEQATVWDYEPGTFRPVVQIQRAPLRSAPQEWIDRRFHAIVTDPTGTPTELVDTAGRIVWRSVTTLWGTPLETPSAGVSCPLRFPGQYHDRETGLAYNLHRYYDPENARYQSPDPLGITPQPNPHAYVHNPTARIDPLGLAPYAPDAPAGTVRAYRWGDRTDPGALLPNLAKHGTESDREVHLLQLGRDANYLRWRAKRHAVGFTEKSPFVSVAGDADRAAVAEDPWLRDIATRSPDLAVLDVPGDRLVIPQIATSSRETEMLYLGDDLPDHLVGWVPNPYRGSGPG